MRSRLSSEACSRTSGGSSGEKISSQVLHTALGTKDSDKGIVFTYFNTLHGFIYGSGGDSGFDSRHLSLAWTESLGETLFACGKAWCCSYVTDSLSCGGYRGDNFDRSQGSRRHDQMPSVHVGGNYHPPSPIRVQDLSTTRDQAVCA